MITIVPDAAGTPDGLAIRTESRFGVQWAGKLRGTEANVRFRQARESDALDLACLIDSASRGLALLFDALDDDAVVQRTNLHA